MVKCQECSRDADFTCSCDLRLKFCSWHIIQHQNSFEGHKGLLLQDELKANTKFCFELIKELDKCKSEIYDRSTNMINIILNQVSNLIKNIEQRQLSIKNIIWSQDLFILSNKENFKIDIKVGGENLEQFSSILSHYLNLRINERKNDKNNLENGSLSTNTIRMKSNQNSPKNTIEQVSTVIDYKTIISNMNINDKITYFKNLNFDIDNQINQILDIKISQDNRYLFCCNIYVGNL